MFFPLLFWEGVVGEFMKFLPITVILTLGASLFMALVFIPVLGGLIGRRQPQSAADKAKLHAAEAGDPRAIGGLTGAYVRALQWAILRPWTTVGFAVALLLAAFGAYGQLGRGVTFFPSIEPEFMQVEVRARDNLSIYERDALVRLVEDRLVDRPEIASAYARSSADRQTDEEVIGTIQLELDEWDTRRKAEVIGEEIRAEMAAIPGIDVQVRTESGGPTSGKPVSLKLSGADPAAQAMAAQAVREAMERLGGFTDVTDSLPLPGVEWRLRVDRSEAARFGADVSLLGQAVQLLTNGITVADYRPDGADGTVDIRVRFPAEERTLEELQGLRVPTASGLVPIANFVTFEPSPRTGTIKREDQRRVVTIEADVAPGLLVNDQITALRGALERMDLPPGVEWSFAGEAEDQQEAMTFLIGAFLAAIGLMFAILLAQFNRFGQAFIVMSAIVFSVAGVLFGLMVTGRPFGIVMGGIGVIALAGIVVNNNIVLIDTYNDLKRAGLSPYEAALRTGAQRLRPVLLTSITTALGLMPMVIGLNIDFAGREIVYGAPSTQWWTELSSAIAGGLVVATALTLIVTPAMLMLGEKRASRARPSGEAPPPEAEEPARLTAPAARAAVVLRLEEPAASRRRRARAGPLRGPRGFPPRARPDAKPGASQGDPNDEPDENAGQGGAGGGGGEGRLLDDARAARPLGRAGRPAGLADERGPGRGRGRGRPRGRLELGPRGARRGRLAGPRRDAGEPRARLRRGPGPGWHQGRRARRAAGRPPGRRLDRGPGRRRGPGLGQRRDGGPRQRHRGCAGRRARRRAPGPARGQGRPAERRARDGLRRGARRRRRPRPRGAPRHA